MESVNVNLGDRSYPIHIGAGILSGVGDLLQRIGLWGKIAVITNPTVAQLYLDPVHDALSRAGFDVTPVLTPDGEEHKELKTLSTIYDQLIEQRFERKSCLLALGGGVVGDLTGLAAATYLRGIPYVQVPTTLLAQVDSSVGGKTAVNHQDGKNLVGVFYQPRLVLIDVAVLRSLPRRELVAGLAEVIKYGVIADPALFRLLEEKIEKLTGWDPALMAQVIETSCAIKAKVVEKDEHEENHRAVLNFGHTIGHALESATNYQRFLHGEAVGIGMAQAAAISAQYGFCDQRSLERIRKLIRRAGLPLEIPRDVSMQSLVQGMEVDKKTAGGKIKFVMCAGIGKTRFHGLTPGEILMALGA
jgi:3-dehydroquinate synthase